ncbi:MAG: putative rane protein [Gemmatimonadetes bacterium]|nr:putative rane protein [Gemmatimonadota bacterium]
MLRRCPNCGGRGIFASYTTLRERCPHCGLRLQRGESDYFIGAYLLNLVAVELLFALVLGAVVISTYPDTPWALVQWGGLALMIAGAVLCYPFSKSVWLAADLIFRPVSPEEMAWHERDGAPGDRDDLPQR